MSMEAVFFGSNARGDKATSTPPEAPTNLSDRDHGWRTKIIMSEVKAYLLNAAAETIRAVMIPAGDQLTHICKLIGCREVEIVRIERSHRLYVGANSMTDGVHSVTDLKGHGSPFAGNLLIVGADERGEMASVSDGIEAFATKLTIVRPVFVPVFETLTGPDIFGTRVIRLDVRIERTSPKIID
ncbi:hypothetical protein [Rhizobium sp. ICMP 5592]|uniref:DUF3846 domain-containing protein n=1 Tax=Rhizobium sp. ICMP 5592 TaxID=2292445 RepID=UPI0025707E49|nr:hypothetical protein [Rhizobium sp. ICMP 5592]